MYVINPSFNFVNYPDADQLLNLIETAYRICYRSEPNGNRDAFIKSKISAGHESPLEHANISIIVTTNRGVTHEIVRHRIASYCQESTRYCNYAKDKFDNQITFIRPEWCSEDILGTWNESRYTEYASGLESNISKYEVSWLRDCLTTEANYLKIISDGYLPQQARDVLNNSVATKIMITMNIREWRHFFKLRAIGTTGKPHPEMQQFTIPMLIEFKRIIPVVFDDLNV